MPKRQRGPFCDFGYVNRVLKELRKERVVTIGRHGYVLVHSWRRLQNRAEFDPVYLQEF